MSGADKFITINGVRLHYVGHGEADRPPLVCLHGVTFEGHSWDFLASAVSDRYRVLSLTARGHGDSDHAESYEGTVFVEDAAAFIEATGSAPAIVCGYSMGGTVGIGLAALHPDRVARLIVVESSPDAMKSEGSRRIGEQMTAGPGNLTSVEEAVASWREGWPDVDEGVIRHLIEHGLARDEDGQLRGKLDPKLSEALGYADPQAEVGGPDLEQILWAACAMITSPVLIVRGTHSDVVSRESAQRMAQTIPDARLAEVDGGHHVMFSNPQGLHEAVKDFL